MLLLTWVNESSLGHCQSIQVHSFCSLKQSLINMAWNPSQYLKFLNPRLKPALDLLAGSKTLLASRSSSGSESSVRCVLDLGCGPGNITPYLCEAFPSAAVDGVDNSQEMLRRATLDCVGKNAHFRLNTIEDESFVTNKKYDLVYSNAALHWCLNHEVLLPRILNNLVSSDGGVLAFQVPDTRNQPSHTLMETAAAECGYYELVKNVRIPRMDHTTEWYFQLLSPHVKNMDLWTTEYTQPLPVTSEWHPVLEFTQSTGLKPMVDALGGSTSEKGQSFLQTYNKLLTAAYPIIQHDSNYVALLSFRRFFLVCQK